MCVRELQYYKPPDVDVAKFNEKIEEILKILAKEYQPCYLMGDLI